MGLINTIRGGLDNAADFSGATRTVKVGANLADNFGRVLRKKPQKPLYAPQTPLVELFRDALGIGSIGTAAIGGIAGMAGRGAMAAPVAQAVAQPLNPVVQGISHTEALTRSAQALKALQAALRAGGYVK